MVEVDTHNDPKNLWKSLRKERKTVTRAFRLNEEWDYILKQEAENQGVSVNVLVNSIFRRYALFDRWTRGQNVISLTQGTFNEILKGISQENLARAGEIRGILSLQNITSIMGLPSNYDSFAFLLRNFFGGGYALWFTCHCHFRENREIFHLQHDLGRKWSVFLQNYFSSYLKDQNIEFETRIYDFALNLIIHRLR